MKAINIIWDTDGEDIQLPSEIDIPNGMTDEDEISDYLSDAIGFCHYGFELSEEARQMIEVKVPLPNGNEITLHCSGETLYEWQIREGWLKENPVIYWSDTEFYHWFFDFKIARKDGWDIWCESVEINNELNKFWVHFYRR